MSNDWLIGYQMYWDGFDVPYDNPEKFAGYLTCSMEVMTGNYNELVVNPTFGVVVNRLGEEK